MTRHEEQIRTDYFNWLVGFGLEDRYEKNFSYTKLFTCLHETEFIYSIPRDSNREEDGKQLRYRFSRTGVKYRDAELYLDGPCSVLEMLIALAIRCEESIMSDTRYGDRTSQWFWTMLNNLGIGSMADDIFDEKYVQIRIAKFLKREYAPDGKGGLFRIRKCEHDLRGVEIWYQMCWYLDTII